MERFCATVDDERIRCSDGTRKGERVKSRICLGDFYGDTTRHDLPVGDTLSDSGILVFCQQREKLDLIFNKLGPDRIAIWCAADPDKTLARLDRLRARKKKPR